MGMFTLTTWFDILVIVPKTMDHTFTDKGRPFYLAKWEYGRNILSGVKEYRSGLELKKWNFTKSSFTVNYTQISLVQKSPLVQVPMG